MDKRKLLLDTNGGQKFSLRHPTIIDTQSQSNHTSRKTGKSIPKVKLTSNNKSSDCHLSPRLKNFPAEEMRKLCKSPRPNVFPFPAAFTISQSQTPIPGNNENNGQGDSIFPRSTLPQIISHNHNQTLSQSCLTHPTSNQVRNSEIPTNSNFHQPWPDRQTHRPFVPNTLRHSNKKQPQTSLNSPIFASVDVNNHSKNTKLHDEAIVQSKSESNNLRKTLNPSQYEKQPVGGRNAAIHRMAHLSQISPQDLNISQVRNDKNNFSRSSQQQVTSQTMVKPSAAWSESMIANNPELYYSGQNTKKNLGSNQRSINSPSHQQYQPVCPLRRSKNTQKDVDKNLTFTPAMIRDQELLVTTMRQQGITEEIMKRQFDALLTEQRRHLMYQQQFKEPREKNEGFDKVGIPIRRRINKFNDDEKPEWMIHITPPRIPYALVEKMENEVTKEKRKSLRSNESFNQEQQKTQQQKQEITYMNHNHKCEPPFYDVYRQQLSSIHNDEHHCENLYCQTNDKSVLHVTQDTQINDGAMIRHKHQIKNGLQDSEMVKKTMKDLINAQNCKGLEYQMNLNEKKQHVQLNSVQDSDNLSMHNLRCRPMSEDIKQEMKKQVSLNGMEDARHLENYDQSNLEYPNRKVCNSHMHENFQMPEPRLEARIIGGIKYIARKMDNIPHSDAPEVSTGGQISNLTCCLSFN